MLDRIHINATEFYLLIVGEDEGHITNFPAMSCSSEEFQSSDDLNKILCMEKKPVVLACMKDGTYLVYT